MEVFWCPWHGARHPYLHRANDFREHVFEGSNTRAIPHKHMDNGGDTPLTPSLINP